MGRYYLGDIEGKFAFGVQPSNAADRFGATGVTPNYITYYFTKEHLPDVEDELLSILDDCGKEIEMLNKHFDETEFYNEDEICEKFGWTIGKLKHYYSERADYILGSKIRDHLKDHDYCEFGAEL